MQNTHTMIKTDGVLLGCSKVFQHVSMFLFLKGRGKKRNSTTQQHSVEQRPKTNREIKSVVHIHTLQGKFTMSTFTFLNELP